MDDRDLPNDTLERPGRKFDLSEDEANVICRELAEMEGVYDLSRCVGGSHAGDTDNAWSVNFALVLSTGHIVRSEIHTTEQVDEQALDQAEQADPTMDALRELTEGQ